MKHRTVPNYKYYILNSNETEKKQFKKMKRTKDQSYSCTNDKSYRKFDHLIILLASHTSETRYSVPRTLSLLMEGRSIDSVSAGSSQAG